jgi:hypothetical protein
VFSQHLMPSKRKNKIREDRLFEDGWFTISEDMWRDPGEVPRKVRLVADVNFPDPVIHEIEKRGIEVRKATELGLGRLADDDLLRRVSNEDCVLITMDADFWSDKKIPLHRCGGLVYVDADGASFRDSDGLELLIVMLKSLGGLRRGVKIKASTKQFFIKNIGDRGQRICYEIRPIRPAVYAREVTVL